MNDELDLGEITAEEPVILDENTEGGAEALDETPAPKPRRKKPTKAVNPRISKAGRKRNSARILIYGKNKTGKTTFLGTMGDKMLVVNMEDGTASIRDSGADQWDVHSWQDVEDLYWYVKQGLEDGDFPYTTLGWDTLTRLFDIVLRNIATGSDGFDPENDIMQPTIRDYGLATQRLKYWIAAFHALPINHVWLCQERSGMAEDTEDAYDIVPDLPQALRAYIVGDCDVVGRTFIRSVVDPKTNRQVPSFRLLVGPNEKAITGDRYKVLKPVIANPKLPDIVSKIFGEGDK